jgi:radical SAM superfamily enzyme YgiQ (UPF0313 family)
MKVMVGYPPIPSPKGVPLLSQNRQFQWFNKPTYVYPMVPAYAATMAAKAGHKVSWCDGIAEEWSPGEFEQRYIEEAPDFLLIEAKTPVIKRYWESVNRLKSLRPATRIALCGDHVTAMPEESMARCQADYVITGGDYDFTLVDLIAATEGRRDMPPGVWFRRNGGTANTGRFDLSRDLNELPLLDRDLTKWELYSRQNGNFRHLPGTYTMVGRDCWWGKCAFCSWTTLYNKWRARTPASLLDEVGHILDRYPVREIFDDTGCFPAGQWLTEFCTGMIERGYSKRVVFGCNMIPGVLTRQHYDLMARAGFRFVLFGLESADQSTLDRIRKCGRAKDIRESMRMAKAAGLQPHVTCMVGYPWETREQAQATIDLTRAMFNEGSIDTLQATIVIPYPGTPLFNECREKGWLKTDDWDRYDMREPVMKTAMPDEEIMAMTRGLYTSFLTPRFVIRKLLSIRGWSDVVFFWRAGLRVLGHLLDFRRK